MAKVYPTLILSGFLAASAPLSFAQEKAPVAPPVPAAQPPPPAPTDVTPAPIEPPLVPPTTQPGAPVTSPGSAPIPGMTPAAIEEASAAGARVRDFEQVDIGQAMRLLARQAKINLVVSDQVNGTVTMRLEDTTPLEAIKIIANAKGLFVQDTDGIYYVKTAAEKAAEPTEPGHFIFSYARGDAIVPLLQIQLQSKQPVQFDARTNTVFYRETISNAANIKQFLELLDKPTKQVMIESRLVEVNANPKQSYGINWAGTVGSFATPQIFRYGGSTPATVGVPPAIQTVPLTGQFLPQEFLRNGNLGKGFLNSLASQFAILSAPSMSATLRLLNEDADAEFLANPRIVTADNQEATIKITRKQPVPELTFNQQTASSQFSGFQDKEFGNTLKVKPLINKENFVTLAVKPLISNKVGDATFTFAGSTVTSPIIDTRELESNVLIRSGDTLAIGGLISDEVGKQHTKVPIVGDIPIIGYAFQERVNVRVKRNLLIFVTPTVINQGYGTGLEDQVTGLNHSGEEYADPNGWRNNARGALRLVPTANRQVAADYPVPGIAPAPVQGSVRYRSSATGR